MKKAAAILGAFLPVMLLLSACSDPEDAENAAHAGEGAEKKSPYSQQFQDMQCHKPHPIPYAEGNDQQDELRHPLSERPFVRGEMKPEFKKAQELWRQTRGGRQVSFRKDEHRPDSSTRFNDMLPDRGYLVIGCASPDGPTYDYDLHLSYRRAAHIGQMIAENIALQKAEASVFNMPEYLRNELGVENIQSTMDSINSEGKLAKIIAKSIQGEIYNTQICVVNLGRDCDRMGFSGSINGRYTDDKGRLVVVRDFDLKPDEP